MRALPAALLVALVTATAWATQDTVYFYDFESGWNGWTRLDTVWQLGHPDSGNGPGCAHSGQNCAGTIINGRTPERNDRLMSPEVTLPPVGPDRKLRLRYYQWFRFGYGSNGVLQISVDGGAWADLGFGIQDSGQHWAEPQLELTDYAGHRVRIGFYFRGYRYPDWGWYVDDVAIVSTTYDNLTVPEDFEAGWGDWWTNMGFWEVGAPVGGPNRAHSGSNCAGTILDGYAPNQSTRLTSPLVHLPDTTPGQTIRLVFYHWYGLGSGTAAKVQASTTGTNWQTLQEYTGGTGGNWRRDSVDVSGYAGGDVYLGFFFAGGPYRNWGWYVDSICFSATTVRDVAVTAILAPGDTVDSGLVTVPQAVVCNNGIAAATFDALFRIGGWYLDSAGVNLVAGEEETLSFPALQAAPRGPWAVSCSARLAGDEHPENDRCATAAFMRVRDAAALAIEGIPDPCYPGPVPLALRAANRGNTPAAVHCIMMVFEGDSQPVRVYEDFRDVWLAPGETAAVDFAPWLARPGHFVVKGTAVHEGDIVPGNDTCTQGVTVHRLPHDVGVVRIVCPLDTVDSNAVTTPEAEVANWGGNPEVVEFEFRAGGLYASVQTDTLAAGATKSIRFQEWCVCEAGPVAVACTARLDGDMNPENDRQSVTVFSRVVDVAALAIVAPRDTINPGAVMPRVRLTSSGNTTAVVRATLTVRDTAAGLVYADTADTAIAPTETVDVAFAAWTANPGAYAVRCSLAAVGDANPDNDTATASVCVRTMNHDVGVGRIVTPGDTARRGSTILPRAVVWNYGAAQEDFSVQLAAADRRDSAVVAALAPGESLEVAFGEWLVDTAGPVVVRCYTTLATDQNPANDTLTKSIVLLSDGRFRALLVGVGAYRQAGFFPYAAEDAEAVRGGLLRYDNWTPDAVTTLRDTAATKQAVRDAITDIGRQMTSADIALLYFTGRAGQAGDQVDSDSLDEADGLDEFLWPGDADSADPGTWISDDEMAGWLDSVSSGGLCVIVEADYAGGFTRDLARAERVLIASCAEAETARRTNGGVFTGLLVDGLEQMPAGNNGAVTAQALFGYAARVFRDPAPMSPGVWTPGIIDSCPGGLPICLREPRPASAMDRVRCYPNPFRPYLGHTTIAWAGVAARTRLRVMDASGLTLLDREQATPTGTLTWDVRDRGGRDLGSGVYVFAVTDSSGSTAVGRFAVIR